MAEVKYPKTFIELLNNIDNIPEDFNFDGLFKLLLPNDIRPHGLIDPAIVRTMPWSSDFKIDSDSRTILIVDDSNGVNTSSVCNSAFQKTITAAIDQHTFPILTRHSEMYKLMGVSSHVQLERFAAPLFGIAGRGAHMTAYLRTESGIKIWVSRRAKHLVTYPGMLDTTVAGGVKASQTPFQCIVDESDEEASLPASLVRNNAKPVGVVTHCLKSARSGLFSIAVLYVYDLELTTETTPKPQDDEVESFKLMSPEEIRDAMLRQEFKPNSSLVMMDFFIRHGLMVEEFEKGGGYADIAVRLKRKLPVATIPLL